MEHLIPATTFLVITIIFLYRLRHVRIKSEMNVEAIKQNNRNNEIKEALSEEIKRLEYLRYLKNLQGESFEFREKKDFKSEDILRRYQFDYALSHNHPNYPYYECSIG